MVKIILRKALLHFIIVFHFIAIIMVLPAQVQVPLVPQSDSISFEGLTSPSLTIELGSVVNGVIQNLSVDRSEIVKKGQALVKLDSRVEQVRLKRAKANIALIDAQIALRQERFQFSQTEFQRKQNLFLKDSISQYDRDEAETNFNIASKSLNEGYEQKKLAEIEIQQAQVMLDLLTIQSPIDGVVTEIFLNIGELVNEQPILNLVQLNPLYVEVIVPATMWGQIKVGDTATLKPELALQGEFQATVTVIDRVIDARSGTFGVRLELPNPDYQLPAGLKCQVLFD